MDGSDSAKSQSDDVPRALHLLAIIVAREKILSRPDFWSMDFQAVTELRNAEALKIPKSRGEREDERHGPPVPLAFRHLSALSNKLPTVTRSAASIIPEFPS